MTQDHGEVPHIRLCDPKPVRSRESYHRGVTSNGTDLYDKEI